MSAPTVTGACRSVRLDDRPARDRTVDLEAEFHAAAAAAGRTDFDALVASGVSKKFLWQGPMRFGVAEIEPAGRDLYEPSPGGARAYVVPANPLDLTSAAVDPGDLIAWLPQDPTRWRCRTGLAPILNGAAITAAVWRRTPLALWSSPLAWLASGGIGSVILSRKATLQFWLGDVQTTIADTIELAEDIERRLRPAPARLPRVLVRDEAMAR